MVRWEMPRPARHCARHQQLARVALLSAAAGSQLPSVGSGGHHQNEPEDLTVIGNVSTYPTIARSVYPAFERCPGLWLDFDSPLVVRPGQDWGAENHFNGHHAWPSGRLWNGTGWTGAFNDFESCMQQCRHRDGCHMFHHADHAPWYPCGVPSTGLRGKMASSEA